MAVDFYDALGDAMGAALEAEGADMARAHSVLLLTTDLIKARTVMLTLSEEQRAALLGDDVPAFVKMVYGIAGGTSVH